MVNEKMAKKAVEAGDTIKASDINSEEVKRHFKGEVLDYFIHEDGTRELVREMDYNIVVENCSVLIAALMKGHAGYAGATYWAVGSGDPLWSNEAPPAPVVSTSQLENETFRKAIQVGEIIFLDASNNESVVPTNKIQITVLFENNEANGELREFAIFGGNASGIANSGLMVNHKIHPLIYKTSALQLERILRLTF